MIKNFTKNVYINLTALTFAKIGKKSKDLSSKTKKKDFIPEFQVKYISYIFMLLIFFFQLQKP